MFHGKRKTLTFSYDDGVTQERRLVELFDRYGLKATFNINSELLGKPGGGQTARYCCRRLCGRAMYAEWPFMVTGGLYHA